MILLEINSEDLKIATQSLEEQLGLQIMWKIKHIFDGDYGCEELQPGQKPKVSVTLVDEADNEKFVSVEDDWLTENSLDVGSEWPLEV